MDLRATSALKTAAAGWPAQDPGARRQRGGIAPGNPAHGIRREAGHAHFRSGCAAKELRRLSDPGFPALFLQSGLADRECVGTATFICPPDCSIMAA